VSLIIDLPPDLEAELEAEAVQLRLPLPEYVVRVIAVGRPPSPMPRTGAEVVAYWEREGLIGTRTDITDPTEHVRALREKAERKNGPGSLDIPAAPQVQ
jgi:hypothetical protein